MTKSEIVIAVFLSQARSAKGESDIRIELAYVLGQQLLTVDAWDKQVHDSIGRALIKNMSGIDRQLSMLNVIQDIDAILKRIS